MNPRLDLRLEAMSYGMECVSRRVTHSVRWGTGSMSPVDGPMKASSSIGFLHPRLGGRSSVGNPAKQIRMGRRSGRGVPNRRDGFEQRLIERTSRIPHWTEWVTPEASAAGPQPPAAASAKFLSAPSIRPSASTSTSSPRSASASAGGCQATQV